MIGLAKELFQPERTVAKYSANGPSPAPANVPPQNTGDQSDGKNGEQVHPLALQLLKLLELRYGGIGPSAGRSRDPPSCSSPGGHAAPSRPLSMRPSNRSMIESLSLCSCSFPSARGAGLPAMAAIGQGAPFLNLIFIIIILHVIELFGGRGSEKVSKRLPSSIG